MLFDDWLYVLGSLESTQLNLGLYATRAIVEAEGTAPPLTEIEVIRRGIRCSTDYSERRSLGPRPYNVQRPETNLWDFHRERRAVSERAWDAALLRFAGGGETG